MPWKAKEATTEPGGEAQDEAAAVPATGPEAKTYSRATLLRVFEQSGEPQRCQHTPPTTVGAATSSEPPSPREESDEPREERGTFPVLALAPASAASRAARGARQGGPKAQDRGAFEQASAAAMAEWLLTAVDPASAPTTVMLRNIPSQFTRKLLQSALKDKGLANAYDYLYLPMDHCSGRSMGYAFINFRTQASCGMFAQAFNGVPVSHCLPDLRAKGRAAQSNGKVFDVRIAQVQGFSANFARVSAGRHAGEKEEWRPIFLDADGKRITITPQPYGDGSAVMWPDPFALWQQQAFEEPYFPPDAWAATTFDALLQQQAVEQEQAAPSEGAAAGADAAAGGASLRAQACEFVPGAGTPVIERVVDGVPVVAAENHLKAKELAEMQAKAHGQPPSGKGGQPPPGSGPGTAKLKQQIEHYFSVNNVCRDMHLRALMDRFGWVRLEALCEFPRVASLGATAAIAAVALRDSESVEISADEHRARIRSGVLREAFPKVVDPGARIRPPAAAAAAAVGGATAQAASPGGAT